MASVAVAAARSTPRLRLTEFLVGVSLAGDVGTGQPLEQGLRVCLLATSLGRHMGLRGQELLATFHAALLHGLGCTAHASENAAAFDDDHAFQRAFKVFDAGDPQLASTQLAVFGAWADPARQPVLAQRFVESAPTVGPYAGAACREVSELLGARLGLPTQAIIALGEVYERYDGLGIPDGRTGGDLSMPGRIVAVADQAVVAAANRGPDAAVVEIDRRSGGHLDPAVCQAFVVQGHALLDAAQRDDLLTAVIAAEPRPGLTYSHDQLPDLCAALATFADLKGGYLIGHSLAVADLAERAAAMSGMAPGEQRDLRIAGLLHDVGRVAVSSSIWDKPGPLGPAERERVILHPHWTAQILRRCPALDEVWEVAAAHHERIDGSGYHRGLAAAHLSWPARLLAAADTFSALTEPRPYRPPGTGADAAAVCAVQAERGVLDGRAVAAVVEAAGVSHQRPLIAGGLTEREVEVLALAARGLSNSEIAKVLVVAPKTVQHHLAHIYDKTGRRTRAGAAVWAVGQGLLPLPGGRK